MNRNLNIPLTDRQEIVRLSKVVEDKNRTIEEFKKYDAKRKAYYERLEENYRMMEERFNEFNRLVDECDGMDFSTKSYIERIVARLYKHKVNDDIEGGALYGVMTRVRKMEQHLSTLTSLTGMVNDASLREGIADEVRALQTIRGNIASYINKKLGKILK